MTIEEFKALVGGTIFTVKFIKKDGSERVMNARLGVAKYVKNSAPQITSKRSETLHLANKVGVFEMSGQYRTIDLNTIVWLKSRGKVIYAN